MKHLTSPPYHPQSNGAIENVVGTIKDKLRKALENGFSLEEETYRFLLDYHSASHATTRKSPVELHLGRKLYTRFDELMRNKTPMEEPIIFREYNKPDKWSEGKIVANKGNVIVEVEKEDGTTLRRHLDQTEAVESESRRSTRVSKPPDHMTNWGLDVVVFSLWLCNLDKKHIYVYF